MQDIEQAIRERAYDLWISDGRQDGRAEAHWLAAQREVLASSLENLGSVSATIKSERKHPPRRRPSTRKTHEEPRQAREPDSVRAAF
jgi:hypothetical protein